MTHYNFEAADRLSYQLSQLTAKLDWLLWLRSTQRKALLGTEHSDHWQGSKRRRFETDFARQQAALVSLKEQASRVQSEVDRATRAAAARPDGH